MRDCRFQSLLLRMRHEFRLHWLRIGFSISRWPTFSEYRFWVLPWLVRLFA